MKHNYSLASRTLRLAILRIGLVSILAGAISYLLNQSTIEEAVRKQLLLSTEQTIQRESLPFREIRELEHNFLDEFRSIDTDPNSKLALVKDFDQIFYRHADGSYTQRPDLFEGKALPDGRRFGGMSATYAPDIPPNDDVKARFTLSYMLSHKYGSTAKGRLFNFYGVVPEKGFPIYQAADIAKAFTYTGPDALKLDTYEFYSRGFGSPKHDTFFTRMYWDYSNNAWMTTVATADVADASGKHRILACVDVLLDELMRRIAHPAIQGAHSTLFLDDGEGTLIYHPDFMEAIKKSEGHASIKSLKIVNDYPLLTASSIVPGKVVLVDTKDDIIAVGRIPETPGVLTIHYPKALMQPAILQNLAIVIALGFLTLLVEIFIIRSILQNQVAIPLSRLMRATRLIGSSRERLNTSDLPTQSQDEIGELARDFSHMAERVQDVHEQLEVKVHERTVALEAANQQLMALSAQQFRILAENTPDFVVRYDLDCRRVFVNQVWIKETGILPEQVLNKSIHETWTASNMSAEEYKAHLQLVMNTGTSDRILLEWLDNHAKMISYDVYVVVERDINGQAVGALGFGRNISALKEVERNLDESQSLILEWASSRERAVEDERKRIAREIHDELGQLLTLLRLKIQLLPRKCGKLERNPEYIDEVVKVVDSSINVVRSVATSLRPAVLDSGLVPALEWLTDQLSQHTEIIYKLYADSKDAPTDDHTIIELFRIVQESLTNVTRHSGGTEVVIQLAKTLIPPQFILEISDNGKGFNPSAKNTKKSLGLMGMHERVRMLSGELSIISKIGQGTLLRICIPNNKAKEEDR